MATRRARFQKFCHIWFFPWENGGVLNMRMQVILDSLFARLGSTLTEGGKKGEFRDWTCVNYSCARVVSESLMYFLCVLELICDNTTSLV
jgi:hypothetical protein